MLLALSPAYVDLLNLGAERYTYAAVGVEPTADGLRYESPPPAEIVRVEGVECYLERPPSAACLAQRTLADGETHTAATTGAPPPGFVSYVHLDGSFYAREYGRQTEDGATRVAVRFRRVAPGTVLEAVSVGRDAVETRPRRIVERGRMRTASPLAHESALGPETYRPAGRFVRTDDGYYLVGRDAYEPPVRHRDRYSLVGAAAGVLVARRGLRLRDGSAE